LPKSAARAAAADIAPAAAVARMLRLDSIAVLLCLWSVDDKRR
jgi:hypothetical protein